MKAFYGLFIALMLVGCSTNKSTPATKLAPPAPSWVESRPLNSAYYIGIGVAPITTGTNYQNTAKQNALSDLASEIKVNVNTNSLLHTLETSSQFQQEFNESIRVQSDLNLEDFEMLDTWADANSYWVYYRLSKAAYAEKIKRKKNTAQELSLDFYAKAEAASNSGNYAIAIDYYLRGLQALENFWNEENRVDYMGQSILLDNTLYTQLRELLNRPQIAFENQIELNFQNKFRTQANVRVTTPSGSPFESVPLEYEYFGLYGRNRGKVMTNADGRATIAIAEADKERAGNFIRVSIDSERLFEPFKSDRFMQKLTETMRGAEVQKSIIYNPPSIYVISKEENLNKNMNSKPVTSAIMASLGRRGITFATSETNADLVLQINTDTQKSGSEQGFYTATLNLNIEILDAPSGESRYTISKNNIKGVDLDFEKAGLKAYQNLIKNIESELMRPLVSDLF